MYYYEEANARDIMQFQYLCENNQVQKEAEKHWHVKGPKDVDAFVKANNLKEVTDPIHFIRDGEPNPNGLLSNEIFGITKDERANTYAYIDLGGWFLNPLAYIIWSRMDQRIKEIVHGTKKFIIDGKGDFVEDANGKNGVKFLKDNIDKIKIRTTESRKRDKNIRYIEKYKHKIFMSKLIVLPAYYRDVNTSGGNVGVGILNKYYATLLTNVKSLKETADYGISMSEAISGRIQEIIVQIYNCICGTSGAETDGIGLSKKQGLVRTAVMSKTSDYGTRLIITSPELKVETVDDMMVTVDYSALPLSSAVINFKPFVLFNVKRFFENEFGGGVKHQVMDEKGNITYETVKDPLLEFSEEVINKELDRFVHGYSNRLKPVLVPLENGKKAYMIFKGHKVTGEQVAKGDVYGESSLINRRLTWCDVFYMASCEAARGRHVLVTRFPIDSMYSQYPTKVRISTIRNTEKVYINGEYYPFYPKITDNMIGKNTSNMFIDTLQPSNLLIKIMLGDYDGDQVSVKGVFTNEANDELEKYVNSKAMYVGVNGVNVRTSSNEAVMSLFSLTKILPESKNRILDNVKLGPMY